MMIFGSVEYEFKDEFGGGSNGLEWAARGVLEFGSGEGEKVVWREYQVFLVSGSFCVQRANKGKKELMCRLCIGYRRAAEVGFIARASYFTEQVGTAKVASRRQSAIIAANILS